MRFLDSTYKAVENGLKTFSNATEVFFNIPVIKLATNAIINIGVILLLISWFIAGVYCIWFAFANDKPIALIGAFFFLLGISPFAIAIFANLKARVDSLNRADPPT